MALVVPQASLTLQARSNPHAFDARTGQAAERSPVPSIISEAAASNISQGQGGQTTPTPTPAVRPRTVSPVQSPTPTPTPAPTLTPTATPAATPTATPAGPANPAATPNNPTAVPFTEADAQPGQTVDEDEVVRVNSNLVLVPTSVVDNRGRAITDLKLEDFELRVDGQLQTISAIARSETPVHIALLFDNSKSLSTARDFEKQAATRFFSNVVRPIDRAAIYSISTTPTLEQPFTNDVTRLVRTIERFGQPEGATALFDTIAHATHYLSQVQGRKIIVIVSDGTDTVSDSTFEEALQSALKADCQIYVVQTRQLEEAPTQQVSSAGQSLQRAREVAPQVTTPSDPIAEQRIQKMTEQTGGAAYVPMLIADLDEAFTQISRDLSQQYVLSYYPPDERKDKYFRFINVRVRTRPNLRVRARKGFYPVAAQKQGEQPAESVTNASSSSALQIGSTTDDARAAAPSEPRRAGAQEPDARAASAATAATFRQSREPSFDRRIGPADTDDERERTAQIPANTSASLAPSQPEQTAQVSNTTTRTAAVFVPAPTPRPTPPSNAPSATPVSATPPVATSKTASTSTDSSSSAAPAPTPSPERAAPAAPSSSSASKETTEKPPVGGGVLNGRARSLPKPFYPPTARSIGISGQVAVEVTVDETGRVIGARAVSGPPLLQSAAVSAARLAKFPPMLVDDKPVKVVGTIYYTFVLP